TTALAPSRCALLFAAAAALLAGPRAGLAYQVQEAPGGAAVRWQKGRVRGALALEADLLPGADQAARRALASWTEAGAPELVPADPDAGAIDLVIRFATAADEESVVDGVLALTHLRYSAATGAIRSAEIEVNARDFAWAAGDDCDDAFDVQSTLTHEIGHALGLAHSEVPGATMATSPAPCDRSRRDLAEDDYLAIAALYHGVELEPAAAAGAGCSAAAGEGGGPGVLLALAALAWVAARRRHRRARRRDAAGSAPARPAA